MLIRMGTQGIPISSDAVEINMNISPQTKITL